MFASVVEFLAAQSPTLLLFVALSCRFLPAPVSGGWKGWPELGLMLGLGLGVGWMGADWFARFYLIRAPLSTADFSEYCEAVVSAMAGEAQSSNPQRSRGVAWILGQFAQYVGIMDGLVLGAILGFMLLVIGVFLWAQAIGGRGAAIGAALSVVSITPLVLMSRAPSFYSELLGGLALASGLCAQALLRRTPPWILLAALSSGMLSLIESRGILWTLPTGGLCLLAAVCARGSWKRRVGMLVGVCVCMMLCWWAGRWVYPAAYGGTLENQFRTFVVDTWRYNHVGEADIWTEQLPRCQPVFNWGWSNPLDLPKTLLCMQQLSHLVDPEAVKMQSNQVGWATQVGPWVNVLAVSLGISVLSCLRFKSWFWRLTGLLGPALPCLSTWLTTPLDPDVRRIAPAFLVAPVLLGLSWATLSEPLQPGEGPRAPLGRPLRTLVLILFITGVIPNFFGPAAHWRVKVAAEDEWRGVLMGRGRPTPWDTRCIEGLSRDQDRDLKTSGELLIRWSRPYTGPL